jgi:hypothetical protein
MAILDPFLSSGRSVLRVVILLATFFSNYLGLHFVAKDAPEGEQNRHADPASRLKCNERDGSDEDRDFSYPR